MPPPPVGGAAVGISLVDEVAGAVTVSVTVTSGVAVEADELTPGVPDAVVSVEVAVTPEEAAAISVKDPIAKLATLPQRDLSILENLQNPL